MNKTWGTIFQMERDKALGNDAETLRKQLSEVAKALAWEIPYQASLAERATSLISERDALKVERDQLRAVVEAAQNMPRWTPKGGGASTKHTYQIEACHTWALDAALTAAGIADQQKAGETR